MNTRNRLLFFVCFLLAAGSSRAQIVGTDCFLQGQWIEVGLNQWDGFGTCSSPATYHAHPCCGSTPPWFTAGSDMDVSFDWGHDGWSTGTPALMGPYTQPGYPQEGWSLQVGATEYRNGGWGSACTGGTSISGTFSYINAGGQIIGNWLGATTAGIQVYQQTKIDTLGSWVNVTTVLRNMTAAPIVGVWYERTCDPDNTSFYALGSSATTNTILHQNEDSRHLVTVTTWGYSSIYNATNSYMAYTTKDCRAKCMTLNSLNPSGTPSQLWVGAGGALSSTLGYTDGGDEGISLVYNLGTIPANDSTIISYAVLFGGTNDIDSALPNPLLVANGTVYPATGPDTADYDTFNVCLYPGGLPSLPVTIIHGDDGDWSWSHWTWSPGTGLSATTGTSVVINTVALPPTITYTITGTDTAAGSMTSCQQKTFYLTLITCNNATVNSPCVGDSLIFNAPGDSTGATYQWSGPAPSTAVFATTQRFVKYPAAATDSGWYTCIKFVAGAPVDTGICSAIIHPLPSIAISSSQANCAPIVGTLYLYDSSTNTPGASYAWTGPFGYTSTDQNPIIYGFDSSQQGTYYVQDISIYGCKSSSSVNVWPGIVMDFDLVRNPGCPFDTVHFNTYLLVSNANVYHWDFGDGTTSASETPAPHIYTGGHHPYTVTFRAANAHCTDSTVHTVDVSHTVTADYTLDYDTICNVATSLSLHDLSGSTKYGTPVALASYSWQYGDGNSDTAYGIPSPAHFYTVEGIYVMTLTVTDSLNCTNSKTDSVWVLQPYMRTVSDTTFCLTSPMPLNNTEWVQPLGIADDYTFTYDWSPADTFLSSSTAHVPTFDGIGIHSYMLTVRLQLPSGACPISHTINLNSVRPATLHDVTASTTIMLGGSVYLNADSELDYTWTPNDGSLNNPNISNPVATPTVTTTYTVYGMDYYGCRDTAMVTIIVDSTENESIPTGFTPNGDGLNDVFKAAGFKYQRLVEMRIFNRWGECVFTTNDRDKGWDGTYKGVPQDMDTYSYTIIVARPDYGDNIVYKGTVTLIR